MTLQESISLNLHSLNDNLALRHAPTPLAHRPFENGDHLAPPTTPTATDPTSTDPSTLESSQNSPIPSTEDANGHFLVPAPPMPPIHLANRLGLDADASHCAGRNHWVERGACSQGQDRSVCFRSDVQQETTNIVEQTRLVFVDRDRCRRMA